MSFGTLSCSHFVASMASLEVDRVERETQTVASYSEDSDSDAEANDDGPLFDKDVRGWTTMVFPISKKFYRIRLRDKIISVPPQSAILLVAVHPCWSMPDEWTIRGVTLFIKSPQDKDENSV